MEVTVDMNTNKLKQKLRAIAKYAEALANELVVIDNTCDGCGGPITTREVYADNKHVSTLRECTHCQTGEGINYE